MIYYESAEFMDRKDGEVKLKRASGSITPVKKGFTLIELLIVMLVLAILAGVVVMAVGGVFDDAKERAYETLRGQIQNAVISYNSENNGHMPPTVGTANISGQKGILDICSLVLPEGMLRAAPAGCISLPDGDDDNCDGSDCGGCMVTSHYIWAIDVKGNVYSQCTDTVANGGSCANNSSDGYQGVWP